MQHITPNSKRWDYSDIPGGSLGQIKGPTHLRVEGGHHPRNRPPTLGTTSVDFYHYPARVWAYSTPQPNTEVPAPTGGACASSNFTYLVRGPLGEPRVIGGFFLQRVSNAGFDIFFGVRLNKRLNKQSNCRRLPVGWRLCNVTVLWSIHSARVGFCLQSSIMYSLLMFF